MEAELKNQERLRKLRELHSRRNEARNLNRKEVVEEDKRNKMPSNWEVKKRKADWILEDEKRRSEAAEKGYDYDRIKLLEVSAEDAEKLGRAKQRKKNPDPGFSSYEEATRRQYDRNVKNIKVNIEKYEDLKEKLGDAIYPNTGTIIHGLHKDSKDNVDKMVEDLERQIAKREKYSRRRMYDADQDIDYINERNMKFNKKLERFYGEYTTEIKQNLERGTAV